MSENLQAPAAREYYLKGRWRHWFWPFLAYSLFCAAQSYAADIFLPAVVREIPLWATYWIVGGKAFLLAAGWVLLYLAFGLRNRVAAYRTLFLINAAITIPLWMTGVLSDGNVIMARFLNGLDIDMVQQFVAGVGSILLMVFRVVFYAVTAFNGKANRLLRAAAIVNLALAALSLATWFLNPFTAGLVRQFTGRYGIEAYGLLNMAVSVAMNLIYLLAGGFFFGVMAYTGPRQAEAPRIEAGSRPAAG